MQGLDCFRFGGPRWHFSAIVGCAAMIGCATMIGCGRRNAPADTALARRSLTTALESWQAGDPPSKIREAVPPITMVDPAWEQGQKLESFEIIGPVADDGVRLTCPVNVVCTGQDGKKSTAQVKYVVGTDPVVTIFRHRSSY
jgi:hypothetical protein